MGKNVKINLVIPCAKLINYKGTMTYNTNIPPYEWTKMDIMQLMTSAVDAA